MPRDGIFSRRTLASFVCLGLLLAALPASFAYGQSTPPRDAAEAWKWMQSLLKEAGVLDPTLNNGVVSGKGRGRRGVVFTIHLAAVSSVAPYAQHPVYGDLYVPTPWYEFPYVSSPGTIPAMGWFKRDHAQRFQAMLVYLARQAQQEQAAKDAADLEAFKPKAAAWRQLAVKPGPPEEARRHQVLAEYAYKQKDVPKAITEYTEALRIFPYWPAGQNNLAFLAGEAGTRPGYNLAVYHMKMYLELVPNAPDAQAAQDSIFIWEDKRTTATP